MQAAPDDPLAQLDARDRVVAELAADPALAHAVLFQHRHTERSPDFHKQWVQSIHGSNPKVALIAFRESAKSSLIEEAVIIRALFRRSRNILIVGENYPTACERLFNVKYELESNELILDIFGSQAGPAWGNDHLILSNGVNIRAKGRGQSLRGAKHRQFRPDFVFLDDFEDEDAVRTPEARNAVKRWYYGVLVPAINKKTGLIRIAGTILHADSALVQISKDPTYETHTVPVWTYDPDTGEKVSSWPESAPLEMMEARYAEYQRRGMMNEFNQEYLCLAEAEESRTFRNTTLAIDTSLRHDFKPVAVIVDPARSASATAAFTGAAACSWTGGRLVVWEARAEHWRPDEIVNYLFEADERFNPYVILVEQTGLSEFLMQPIRQECLKRQRLIPVEPLDAPRQKGGKTKETFIKGLQPFVDAGEVVLAHPAPELQAQLANFPAGRIDTLNALAYMLLHHPGDPVYGQAFHPAEAISGVIEEDLPPLAPRVLGVSAATTHAAAVLLALKGRDLLLLDAAVVQGAPMESAKTAVEIVQFGRRPAAAVLMPRRFWQPGDHTSLRAAMARMGLRPRPGADEAQARSALMTRMERGTFKVAAGADWAIRALCGGYAWDPQSRVIKPNVYATLMQAVEAASQEAALPDAPAYNAATRGGRPYLSARG